MSSTTIPTNGNTSPEYVSIRATFEGLSTLFEVDLDNSASRLFEAGLITRIQSDASAMVSSVLRYVSCDPIMFYKFLGVLYTFGTGSKGELESISRKFVEAINDCTCISSRSANNMKAYITFVSVSKHKYSFDAHDFAKRLHGLLKDYGCDPWIEDVDLGIGEYRSVSTFKTLQLCKAIIPVVSRGYTVTHQCLRELYYAKSIKAVQLHPVIVESGWDDGHAGKWLKLMVGEVKCVYAESDDKETALRVARDLGNIPMDRIDESDSDSSLQYETATSDDEQPQESCNHKSEKENGNLTQMSTSTQTGLLNHPHWKKSNISYKLK